MRIAVAADNEPIDAVSDPPYGEKNSRVEIRLFNEWLGEGGNLQGRPAPRRQAALETVGKTTKNSSAETSTLGSAKAAEKP